MGLITVAQILFQKSQETSSSKQANDAHQNLLEEFIIFNYISVCACACVCVCVRACVCVANIAS